MYRRDTPAYSVSVSANSAAISVLVPAHAFLLPRLLRLLEGAQLRRLAVQNVPVSWSNAWLARRSRTRQRLASRLGRIAAFGSKQLPHS